MLKYPFFLFLLFATNLNAQNFYGRWYLLDFMKARTGVIHGTFFTKDTVKHFITDPFLSGTYLDNLKYPYSTFKHLDYDIICQKDEKIIYVIVLKYVNHYKSEIYVPDKYFYSVDEVRQYLNKLNLKSEPFIPVYHESYLRTFSQLKPFHTITTSDFEKAILNAFKLFDEFEKKYKNHHLVKAHVLINLLISQSLIRLGYSPFVISFPEYLTQGKKMNQLSNQLDSYTKKW